MILSVFSGVAVAFDIVAAIHAPSIGNAVFEAGCAAVVTAMWAFTVKIMFKRR